MKLFYVRMHNDNPPMIMFGETRAKVGRLVKKMLGPDMVDEVIPISRQDAEMTFGDKYLQQARWNMLRSEEVSNTSVLTGDNPFLREKMDMKKADMGDVIDDFKKSDAPQFQGKSVAKKRQMAIAAKLNAEQKEELNLKLSTVTEGIDQKVLKTFKVMIKDGEEDSVRLLIQGMPKHTKMMYMKKLGLKEEQELDTRTKVFRETVQRLNMSKQIPVIVSEDENWHKNYPVTYSKRHSPDGKSLHVKVKHVSHNLPEKPYHKNPGPSIKHQVKQLPKHKELKDRGYEISHYGTHDNHDSHEKIHGNKPNITKEDVSEKNIEEKTPIKLMVKDKKIPNLKIPNPNHKRYNELVAMQNKKSKPSSADVYREEKK